MTMRSDIVVFLGPTLDLAEARTHLDAVYLPPVGQGDVLRMMRKYDPAAIAIIDGVFASRPAVRHKELLWAISKGLRIYGAASMGAIRAAELADFGMIGSGLIYRWFRRVHTADDADVAVAMCPPELGSLALSDALVDIRTTLKRAERAGVINREDRLSLEEAARRTHFSDRNYGQIFAAARRAISAARAAQIDDLETWMRSNRASQKKLDAIALLRALSLCQLKDCRSPREDFVLTDAWCHDLDMAGILHLVT